MLRKAAVPKRICDRRRAQNAFMGWREKNTLEIPNPCVEIQL